MAAQSVVSEVAGGMTLPVWHDGGCPLSRREIAFMRRLDRRGAIDFVDASDASSICPRDQNELLATFHAREDGQMLSGAAAFAAMWRGMPGSRPFGLARAPWILAALEHFYRAFLIVRPRLKAMARQLEAKRS